VEICPLRGSTVGAISRALSAYRLDLIVAFNVEEVMRSVGDALVVNMKNHPDSPLNLDKDFNLELRIKVGDYNLENNSVENLEPNEVGIFINISAR
jgi:hypothetical protein